MKVGWSISIEEEDARTLDKMCEIMGISRTKLMESTIKGFVVTAKASGILKRKKANPIDMVKFFAAGTQVEI